MYSFGRRPRLVPRPDPSPSLQSTASPPPIAHSTVAYPGVGKDLRWQPWSLGWGNDIPHHPIGAHANCWDTDSEVLPVREIFMMAVMNTLTDKPGWQSKVFDDDIVARWRREALDMPEDALYDTIVEGKNEWQSMAESRSEDLAYYKYRLIKPRTKFLSEKAFDFCIAELRNKASYAQETGLVPVLDSSRRAVCKSDTIVSEALQQEFRKAFQTLKDEQGSQIDWHPRSNEMVQDLVHPSLYPFVYGRSRFIPDEDVGVENALNFVNRGELVPPNEDYLTSSHPDYEIALRQQARNMARFDYDTGGSKVPPEYWSTKFQWLPANLAFREDGTVRFTSYVNNLHPLKHLSIYQTIEKLVDIAIPAWNQCLTEYRESCPGRSQSRFSPPDYDCSDENDDVWEPMNPEVLAQADIQLPPDDIKEVQREMKEDAESSDNREDEFQKRLDSKKWTYIRDPLIPEPDEFQQVDYAPQRTISEKFHDSGLQVIVKMASIELTPEKPDFPIGGWHIEGLLNERIAATALYYLYSENVTPSHLDFRMQTSYDQDDLQAAAGQDSYSFLERVYGTQLGANEEATCLQYYGSVETREGRLLAFPNVFQHRVSPFSLKDRTKPGHRRFIALWLVDPYIRTISTANVPPQQRDWWQEATFGPLPVSATDPHGAPATSVTGDIPGDIVDLLLRDGVQLPSSLTSGAQSRLPPELLEMVRKEGVIPPGFMGRDEAEQLREELMDERTQHQQESERSRWNVSYNFCEH